METFHDVLTTTLDEDAKSLLEPRQKDWVETFFRLASPKNRFYPSDAEIARALGISRTASNRLKKRLLKRLLPKYRENLGDKADDFVLEGFFLRRHIQIKQTPEFLEKVRGRNRLRHWRAIKDREQRIGLTLYHGYELKGSVNIRSKRFKNLPIRQRTDHGPSILNRWWTEKIFSHAREKKISPEQAYLELHQAYFERWGRDADFMNCLCRACGDLLPIGETIDGRQVTRRRKYCSNTCKTLHKRRK